MAEHRHQHQQKLFNACSSWMCLHVFLLLVFTENFVASSIVKSLPGFSGDLPFKLETGYVGVGETEDVQLFYYFVESQRSPADDPLLIWLVGGPGCSTLLAFFYESGPLSFDYTNYNGSLPTLHLNPFTWTKGLNIIYLDAPVGTGFSYATSSESYKVGDYKFAAQTYEFLGKWLMDHPSFLKNQLYVGGQSYSGIPVPMIVQAISNGNDIELKPYMNLKGYILGNPKTDEFIDSNSKIPFAHRLTLISDELYKSAKTSCNGNYVDVDPSNDQCLLVLQAIDVLVNQINSAQVLEPTCATTSAEHIEIDEDRRSLKENSRLKSPALWCRSYDYVLVGNWARDKDVQKALHVREGTIGTWKLCDEKNFSYTDEVTSSLSYHRNLTTKGYRALIYSGDHDMNFPHIGTQEWIASLNLTLENSWRAWFVDGQVAGYTKKYMNTNTDFSLTFVTIKGGGHIADVYKPKEAYSMIDRWFAYYPL